MDLGPRTFRDPVLSVFQSAAEDIARQIDNASAAALPIAEGAREIPSGTDVRKAAEYAGGLRVNDSVGIENLEVSTLGTGGGIETAKTCALLALQYFEAKLKGDMSKAQSIQNSVEFSHCDPRWAKLVRSISM
jgi:hypothetical protein